MRNWTILVLLLAACAAIAQPGQDRQRQRNEDDDRRAAAAAEACLVGQWNWVYTGGVSQVTINADGTLTDGRKPARWTVVNARDRKYSLAWPTSVDNVTVSADCRNLSGANAQGTQINATRIMSDREREADRERERDRERSPGACVVGQWNWNFTGGSSRVTISPDGTMTDGAKSGRWRLADQEARVYVMIWPSTVDLLIVEPDCRALSGINNQGVKISASRR